MTEAKAAHVFIDTNLALHYQRPDQVDWCALTGCDQVVLVATPTLLRELEKQKVHNPTGKLRKRAGAYIKWLAGFVRNPALEVRPATTWHFIPNEPQIDFRQHSLSMDVADDHIIASVLSYTPSGDPKVHVATADLGMEIKLGSRGIAPLLMPESAMLPDEPDEQEKELRDLRRKVAEKRIPVLTLVTELEGGRHSFSVRPKVTMASVTSPEEVRHKYPPLRGPDSLTPEKKADLSAAVKYQILCAEMCGVPQDIDAYNLEREAYFTKYDAYYRERLDWEELAALTVQVNLTLFNDGTAPATDIDIYLHLPDDVIVFKSDAFPKRPKEPKPPRRTDMLSLFSSLTDYDHTSLLRSPSLFVPDVDINSSVAADQDKHRIRYWSRNLKHGFTEKLDAVYFRFPNRQAVRNFEAEYEISASELSEPASGTLHFGLS